MFQSVRARLTLWYCGLLAVVLVTFGVVSYLRIASAIRAETDASLSDTAHELTSAFRQLAFEEGEGRDVPLDFRFSDRALLVIGRTAELSPRPVPGSSTPQKGTKSQARSRGAAAGFSP